MAANTLAPNGFLVTSPYGMSVPNYAIQVGRIAYNYASQIGFGDPVKLLTDGTVNLFANGDTTIHGIFAGCQYVDPSTGTYQFRPSWPAVSGLASTAIVTAKMIVDPRAVFRVQVSGTALTQAAVGANIDIVDSGTGVSGSPNAAGISTCALKSSTLNTTNTLPFRVVGIVSDVLFRGYDPTGTNNFALVTMNTSDINNTTGI